MDTRARSIPSWPASISDTSRRSPISRFIRPAVRMMASTGLRLRGSPSGPLRRSAVAAIVMAATGFLKSWATTPSTSSRSRVACTAVW